MPKSFEDLDVYQLAFAVTKEIYQVTHSFPADERFGLTNQIRRASVSIISNIAEGSLRLSSPEFRHFIGIARGSVAEVRCQLRLAMELGFMDAKIQRQIDGKLISIGKMLTNLAKALMSKA